MDSRPWDSVLLGMTNRFLAAGDLGERLEAALIEIEGAIDVIGCVILRGSDGRLEPEPRVGSRRDLTGDDRAAAIRALETRAPNWGEEGVDMETRAVWLPLAWESGVLGVLGARGRGGRDIAAEDVRGLGLCAAQLALLLACESRFQQRARADSENSAEAFRKSLIDSVSHELKSPLSVIEAALDGLGGDPADAALYLAEALHALRRVCRTVDNLLDVGRVESGAVNPKPEWCSIADICDVAIQLTGDVMGGREVRCLAEPAAPLVKVDEVLTCQALVNLLHNAAVHTPPGTDVAVQASAGESGLRLEVLDRGPGLSPEERARAFEKFFKGRGAASGCSGLGLAVARGFVEAQGGAISIDERLGGGAVFRIQIPCEIMAVDVSHGTGGGSGLADGRGP